MHHTGLIDSWTRTPIVIFKKIILFSCLFLAVLGLCCRAGFSLIVVIGDVSLVAACQVLVAVASFVVGSGL